MPLSVSASMMRCQPSVRLRSASAALTSAGEAAVSNMVPSGAVAFWRSEWDTVCGIPRQSQHGEARQPAVSPDHLAAIPLVAVGKEATPLEIGARSANPWHCPSIQLLD